MRLSTTDRPISHAGHVDVPIPDAPRAAGDVARLIRIGVDDDTIAALLDIELVVVRFWRALDDEPLTVAALPVMICRLATGGTRTVRRRGVETVEHVPADTRAAIFWLRNRQPGEWGQRPERGGLA